MLDAASFPRKMFIIFYFFPFYVGSGSGTGMLCGSGSAAEKSCAFCSSVLNKTKYLEGTISPMEMGTLLSGGQKERSIPFKHGPKYL
jgi:hypothetical protein